MVEMIKKKNIYIGKKWKSMKCINSITDVR